MPIRKKCFFNLENANFQSLRPCFLLAIHSTTKPSLVRLVREPALSFFAVFLSFREALLRLPQVFSNCLQLLTSHSHLFSMLFHHFLLPNPQIYILFFYLPPKGPWPHSGSRGELLQGTEKSNQIADITLLKSITQDLWLVSSLS